MGLLHRENKYEEEFRELEERKKKPGRCQGLISKTWGKQESRIYRMKER